MSEIKRPDIIPGYVHPQKLIYTEGKGIYKTFTEGLKAKKKEKFGSTSVGKKYAYYETKNDQLCPVCDSPPIMTCNCGHSDKRCVNSHSWYTDRRGNIKEGNPHEK